MTPLVYPDWRSKVVFSGEGPQPQILVENEKLKVVVAGLEAGQRIPAHPESLAMYHFLDGSGWMTVAGERASSSSSRMTSDAASKSWISWLSGLSSWSR